MYATIIIGITIIINIDSVVDISFLAVILSLCAKSVANLFLKPLPNPISSMSIHTRIELKISHIPLLYTPRHRKVNVTNNSCIIPFHPLSIKDIIILRFNRFERLIPSSVVGASLYDDRILIFTINRVKYFVNYNIFASVAIIVAIDATDVPIVIFSAIVILLISFSGTTISHPGFGLAFWLTFAIVPFM